MTKTDNLHKIFVIGIAAFMALIIALPSIVYAQEEVVPDRSGRSADVTARIAERKATTLIKIKEKRAAAELKSEEARTAACERRQEKLGVAMSNFTAAAAKHASTFDSIFVRIQGFYDSGQLTVSNYTELVAAVSASQSVAQVEVGALAALNVEIDCEDPDVASAIATFRDSAAAARESLRTYRASLTDLISSLKAQAAEDKAANASESDESTDSSSDESTSTDETETN